MELLYTGKTKDVYQGQDSDTVLLKFKDDVTGKNGIFDPGENQIVGQIEGIGNANLKITSYYFEKLNAAGIPTHYISSNLEDNSMTAKKCKAFGEGLEVICRFFATGSFIRRYGLYAEEMQDLKGYVEVTLKDDARQDPLITKNALVLLGILEAEQYEDIVQKAYDIAVLIRDDLAERGLTLIDIKFEFGYDSDSRVLLIDEVSAGNMRVYKDGAQVSAFDVEKAILTD